MRSRHKGTGSSGAWTKNPCRARLKGLLKTLAWPDRVHLAAWAGLAISVSGCTTLGEYVTNGFKVGPNYTRPPAPVAPDWIDASDKRLRTDSEENRLWWAVFDDPVMTALVNRAYQENLTVRQAGFRVLESRAQLQIAVGTFFPQEQSANGYYSRSVTSQTAANRSFLGQRYFSTWGANFSLAWELDFWGRFRRSIESASDSLDASVDNYDDVLVTLVADVATTYVQIRTLEKRIMLAEDNVKLQTKNFEIAKAQFEGGKTSKIDQDQAEADLYQTKALIPTFQLSLRQANDHLCTLLGIPPRDLNPVMNLGRAADTTRIGGKKLSELDDAELRKALPELLGRFENSPDIVLLKESCFAGGVPGRWQRLWPEWIAIPDTMHKDKNGKTTDEKELDYRLRMMRDRLEKLTQSEIAAERAQIPEITEQIAVGELESALRTYKAIRTASALSKPDIQTTITQSQFDFQDIIHAGQSILGVGDIPTAPVAVSVGLPAQLLTRRPDVRRAERTAAAQCAQIGFADSDFYPHVSVIGTIGVESSRLSTLFEQFSQQSAIGPTVQWNILNYGRILGNVRLQDSTFQELVAVYQNTVLQANSEVEDGLIAFFKSQEQALANAKSARQARTA